MTNKDQANKYRIALIYPALPFDKEHHLESLPIGLLYLTAIIEEKLGINVDIYDSRFGQAFPNANKATTYDIIGFTAMTMQIDRALVMAKKLRGSGYLGKIVFGGPHASVAPEHLKTYLFLDAIFIGEAENNFIKYINYLMGRHVDLERVWIRDKDDEWKWFPGNNFIEDLDSIPHPARDKYASIFQIKSINITTTRGCPFNCNYCQPTKRLLFGKKVRRRSVDNIIQEIDDAVKQFNITHFSIDDDTFTFDNKVVLAFSEAIRPYGLTWSCQSRSDIESETLKAMFDSGCEMIYVGIESGSQRVLDLMNKKNTVGKNAAFIKLCNDIGIKVWCNIMLGYPGETLDDMKKSLEFVRHTKPPRVCVSQVTPFPGTNLWNEREDDIIIRDWGDIARHIQKPKFRSMACMQYYISYYTILLTKQFDMPLVYDTIHSSKLLTLLSPLIPYLLHFKTIVPLLRKISMSKIFFKYLK